MGQKEHALAMTIVVMTSLRRSENNQNETMFWFVSYFPFLDWQAEHHRYYLAYFFSRILDVVFFNSSQGKDQSQVCIFFSRVFRSKDFHKSLVDVGEKVFT